MNRTLAAYAGTLGVMVLLDLVWLGLIGFFGSIILSNAINPAAGRVGPEVYQGWPNRFMVVVYNVWLMVVARRAARQPTHALPR